MSSLVVTRQHLAKKTSTMLDSICRTRPSPRWAAYGNYLDTGTTLQSNDRRHKHQKENTDEKPRQTSMLTCRSNDRRSTYGHAALWYPGILDKPSQFVETYYCSSIKQTLSGMAATRRRSILLSWYQGALYS